MCFIVYCVLSLARVWLDDSSAIYTAKGTLISDQAH